MGAKMNNSALNQVRIKEQKKFHKRNLERLFIFLEISPRTVWSCLLVLRLFRCEISSKLTEHRAQSSVRKI